VRLFWLKSRIRSCFKFSKPLGNSWSFIRLLTDREIDKLSCNSCSLEAGHMFQILILGRAPAVVVAQKLQKVQVVLKHCHLNQVLTVRKETQDQWMISARKVHVLLYSIKKWCITIYLSVVFKYALSKVNIAFIVYSQHVFSSRELLVDGTILCVPAYFSFHDRPRTAKNINTNHKTWQIEVLLYAKYIACLLCRSWYTCHLKIAQVQFLWRWGQLTRCNNVVIFYRGACASLSDGSRLLRYFSNAVVGADTNELGTKLVY